MTKEIRLMEIRAVQPENEQDKKMTVEGYAVRFNEPATFSLGGTDYYEIVDPGALSKADLSDVPFKYNHSDNVMIMARTRSKTLQLVRDNQGLKIVAELADTTAGRDLYTLIKRGDIDKMSFAFTVRKDSYDTQTRTRTILDIDKLYDVSAVDVPAYDTTSISARSFFELERDKELKVLESAELRKRAIKTSLEITNLIYGGKNNE